MDLVDFIQHNYIQKMGVPALTWPAVYIVSFVIFKTVYRKTLLMSQQTKLAQAVVSATHGLVSGCIGFYIACQCQHDVLKAQHWLVFNFCFYSLSYFMFDLMLMFYVHFLEQGKPVQFKNALSSFISKRTLMIAHHLVLIFIMFPLLVATRFMGNFFAGCLYFMELPVFFLNIRAILSILKQKKTNLYLVNGIFLSSLFFVCRILLFPFMYYVFAVQQSQFHGISYADALSKIPVICTASCCLILAPQIYWFSIIFSGMIKVLLPLVKKDK